MSIQEEIAKAQAELDAQEEAFETADETKAKKAQLDLILAKIANNAKFAEVQAANPDLSLARVDYDNGLGLVIVKRPNHLAYRSIVDQDKVTSASCEKFVLPLIIYPSKNEFIDLITTGCKCDLLTQATVAAKQLAESQARVIAKKSVP